MVVDACNVCLYLDNLLVAFCGIELQDAPHFNLHQFQNIIAGDISD